MMQGLVLYLLVVASVSLAAQQASQSHGYNLHSLSSSVNSKFSGIHTRTSTSIAPDYDYSGGFGVGSSPAPSYLIPSIHSWTTSTIKAATYLTDSACLETNTYRTIVGETTSLAFQSLSYKAVLLGTETLVSSSPATVKIASLSITTPTEDPYSIISNSRNHQTLNCIETNIQLIIEISAAAHISATISTTRTFIITPSVASPSPVNSTFNLTTIHTCSIQTGTECNLIGSTSRPLTSTMTTTAVVPSAYSWAALTSLSTYPGSISIAWSSVPASLPGYETSSIITYEDYVSSDTGIIYVPPTVVASPVPSSQITSIADHQWLSNITASAPTSILTSTYCSATPSPTYGSACKTFVLDGCIPCQGQPDSDPDNWCGLTIDSDYYHEWPKTCRKVICHLEVTSQIMYPDGIPRLSQVINSKLPGDLLEFNWGDRVEVTMINLLPANGTSAHFHGVRQLHTNQWDGVPSITQCPIPGNGGVMTYKWTASQYGSSWYHSHYSLQAWEGVVGPLVIHGPTTAPFDVDLGHVMINDWLHTPVFELFGYVEQTGSPIQDNGLINGKNIYIDPATNITTGERAKFVFEAGKKHKMSIVSTSLDSTFAFSIDGHSLTVIATDFVPVVPFTTNLLKISIGQRYDIIVEANQDTGSFWMRADALTEAFPYGHGPLPCGSPSTMGGNTKAIVTYDGYCGGLPSSNSVPWPHDNVCEDNPYDSIIPWLSRNVGDYGQVISETVIIAQDPENLMYRWLLNGTSGDGNYSTFLARFGAPTLLDIAQNSTAYAGSLAITAREGQWVYVVIQSPLPLPHPIHLHGHDVFILRQGQGAYDPSLSLNTVNPPRRDVAVLPSGGHLVLAFFTDNPGAWLMHCHIGWHISMGFALQIIESPVAARACISEPAQLIGQCGSYNKFAAKVGIIQNDSGV